MIRFFLGLYFFIFPLLLKSQYKNIELGADYVIFCDSSTLLLDSLFQYTCNTKCRNLCDEIVKKELGKKRTLRKWKYKISTHCPDIYNNYNMYFKQYYIYYDKAKEKEIVKINYIWKEGADSIWSQDWLLLAIGACTQNWYVEIDLRCKKCKNFLVSS